jgi:malonyl-CoA/methylmalonyl-CoA synthetase
LPQGEVGVIDIRGPNVFKGYWRMPEKTNEEFRADGFFVSGDLGYVDAKGYIYISGRAKDLVISGGYNVYPAEIEAAIEAVPGVAECAVIGVPHADFGEAVVAIVAPKPGTKIDEKQIQAAIAGDLAKYKQPKRVFVTSDIPRNTMGKIQKKDLREAYRGTFGGPQARP